MKIGIIVAVIDELNALLKNNDFKFIKKEEDIFDVYIYEYNKHDIYVIHSGVGMVAASSATSYLILKHQIDYVINYGVAGSLNPNLKVSDICIVNYLIDGSFDTSRIDNCLEYQHIELNLPQVIKIDNVLMNKIENILDTNNIIKVKCFSSNKFIGTSIDKLNIYKKTASDICEMEAIGIYLTTFKYNIPSIYLKGISDDCNDNINEQFNSNTINVSKKLIKVLKEILSVL